MPSNIVLTARLAAREGTSTCPPAHVLDRIAETKMTGGYDTGRKNRCPVCFTARSVNGTCACSE